jgi:hypothetical protein
MMTKHEFYDHSDILKRSRSAINVGKLDVHARLMRNYKGVPEWWFLILLVGKHGILYFINICVEG